jgi:hypothetical protein
MVGQPTVEVGQPTVGVGQPPSMNKQGGLLTSMGGQPTAVYTIGGAPHHKKRDSGAAPRKSGVAHSSRWGGPP